MLPQSPRTLHQAALGHNGIGEKPMIREETVKKLIKFRDDRDWRQFHTPKDLAISLSLEAAELLEVFQWSGADMERTEKLDKIK